MANFSSPPKNFYLKDILCRKNNKAYKSAEYEHNIFLTSQKKRIEDLSTYSQRKKNLYDYTVHLSLFFCRKEELQDISNYNFDLKNTENLKKNKRKN